MNSSRSVQREPKPNVLILQVSPPIDPADCVCGSSGLWWYQTVSKDQKVIDLAGTATNEVRRLLKEGFGMGFWEWLQKEGWMPMTTVCRDVLLYGALLF